MFSGFKWQILSLLGNTWQYLLLFVNFFLSNSSGYFHMSEHAQYSCPLLSLFPMWVKFLWETEKGLEARYKLLPSVSIPSPFNILSKTPTGNLAKFKFVAWCWPSGDINEILQDSTPRRPLSHALYSRDNVDHFEPQMLQRRPPRV